MTQPPGPQGPCPQHPQGQPPSGGFPQQQPGYGPPHGQPGGYGPPRGRPGGYGPPQGPPPGHPPSDGFPGGEPPKKSPLPWILGGVGALVVIGGVILLIVLLGGDDAEAAANKTLDYLKAGDVDGLISITCKEFRDELEKEGAGEAAAEGIPDDTTEEVAGVTEVDENTAEVTIAINEAGNKQNVKSKFVKEDGEWKFCGLPGMASRGGEDIGPSMPPSMPEAPSVPEMPDMPDMPN